MPYFFLSTLKHDLEDLREEKSKVYCICLCFCSLFFSSFLTFRDSFFYLFSVQRASFSHSFRVSMLATNSFNFSLAETVLISLSFLKIFSLEIGFCVDSSLLSVLVKCANSFWPPQFMVRNVSFKLCFPYR